MIQVERHPAALRLLETIALALIVGLVVYWMAVRVVEGSASAFLAPFAILVLIIVRRPILGFYIYFFVVILVPYWVRVTWFPLFNSPLDIVALSTLGLAGARFLLLGKTLPRNRLLIPWFLSVGILALHVLFQHGPSSDLLLYRFLQGSVPFVLIVLLLETPRHTRNLLIAGVGAVCVMVFLWLPFMISFYISPWFEARVLGNSLLRACHSFPVPCAGTPASWLGIQGTTPVAVVAMIVPLLFSLTLSWPSTSMRRLFVLLLIACLVFIAFSTFFIKMGAALLGMAWVVWINRGKISKVRLMGLLILAVPFILLSPGPNIFSSGISQTIYQITTDTGRWGDILTGFQLFLSAPLTGIGGYFATWFTPDGTYLPAHSSLIMNAYKFGLPYMLALVTLFVVAALEVRWLLRQQLTARVRSIVTGFAGGFVVLLLLSTFNPAFGNITPDNIFWLFMGIASTWAWWLRRSSSARLIP